MGFWAELKRRHLVKILIGYVAVAIAVLEGASLILPSMDLPDWAYNLIVAAVIVGLPLALVLGWALQVSPEGEVTRIRAAAPAAPAAPPEEPGAGDGRSIAVLPFANLSGDPDNEYFSDGITEEILSSLARVRDLRVISRTSVMLYKGSSKGVREIASELGVAHVVEGSVRRAGDRVRITAQLIEARGDTHLWSESYDRGIADVFAIQIDVAERIVRSLRATLTPAEKARLEDVPTRDTAAYERYLRGRHLLAKRTEPLLRRAIELFERAVRSDPEFALAWSGLAVAWAVLPSYSASPVEEAVREARAAARRALELDPALGEAHAALGMAAQNAWEIDESQREFARAYELSPGSSVVAHWYALALKTRGRLAEALAMVERGLEHDPLSLPLMMAQAVTLSDMGRDEEAEGVCRRALELDPDYRLAHQNLAANYERQGRLDEALEESELIARREGATVPLDVVEEIRRGYAEKGPQGYWEAALEAFRRRPDLRGSLLEQAIALCALGRLDEVMDIFEDMERRRDPTVLRVKTSRAFDALRGHPRYRAMIERIGL